MKKQNIKSNEKRARKAHARKTDEEGARSGRQPGKGSANLADTLFGDRLVKLIDGARLACARPRYQTQFKKEYDAYVDAAIRRRLAEEAVAETASDKRARSRLKSPPKSECGEH